MGFMFLAQVRISKQEDGLWRLEVPDLQGCWVDAPTLKQGIAQVQEVLAMVVDVYQERGWPLPPTLEPCEDLPRTAILPVLVEEHPFRRIAAAQSSPRRRRQSL